MRGKIQLLGIPAAILAKPHCHTTCKRGNNPFTPQQPAVRSQQSVVRVWHKTFITGIESNCTTLQCIAPHLPYTSPHYCTTLLKEAQMLHQSNALIQFRSSQVFLLIFISRARCIVPASQYCTESLKLPYCSPIRNCWVKNFPQDG